MGKYTVTEIDPGTSNAALTKYISRGPMMTPARSGRMSAAVSLGRRKRGGKNRIPRGAFKNFGGNDPFPPRKSVKLIYESTFQLTCGATSVYGSQRSWALNGLYDTDISGTGHQPYGFDQMAGLYRKYRVNKCKLLIQCVDPNEDAVRVAAILQSPDGTINLTSKALDSVKELPMVATRTVNDSGSQKGYISQSIPISAVSGLSKTQFKADLNSYCADVSANPTKVATVNVAAASLRASGTAANILCSIKMIYYTTFWERKVQAQS